jgi:hypothetical protein
MPVRASDPIALRQIMSQERVTYGECGDGPKPFRLQLHESSHGRWRHRIGSGALKI